MHDITAARTHALPALYHAAATADLPTLADLGYDGAGLGVHIPVKQPTGGQELDINTRTRNAIQRSRRCQGERGFALLTGRWRALQHITASPSKIGLSLPGARPQFAVPGLLLQEGAEDLGESLWFFQEG